MNIHIGQYESAYRPVVKGTTGTRFTGGRYPLICMASVLQLYIIVASAIKWVVMIFVVLQDGSFFPQVYFLHSH